MDLQRKKNDNRIFALISVLMTAGIMIVYSNHFRNPFHFDDVHTIVSNPAIRSIGNIPQFFVDPTTTSSLPANQVYRPGVTTLNAIDYWIAGGLNPLYFHISIFIAFLLQALFMFLIFRRLLDMSHRHKWNRYFALFAVGWYCYHTAMAETVNYVISRSDGFSTLMVLVSLYVFMFFPKKRKFYLYLIPFIFGFFVKEPALMLIPILGLYVYLFEEKASLTHIFKRKAAPAVWASVKAIFPMTIIGAVLFYISQSIVLESFNLSTLSRFDYLITQPFVIVHYFTTFLYPGWLSADTDWNALGSVADIRLLMGLMFIAGVVILAFRLSRKEQMHPVSFGLLWFLATLVPTSSIIPLSEVLNDHRIYFPFVGLALALSYLIIKWL
ncbi:MAG: hypothetical protein KKA07_16815, partial [Bacteroidetes bacterium]|nr:hypothetical protein [Bacteroidota bacterium]